MIQSPLSTLAVFVFALGGSAVLIPSAERPFMTVHSIEVDGPTVIPDRTIHVDYVIADWRVTIISADKDAPSCATIPGLKPHEGWSDYSMSEPDVAPMHMDVWVGDEGCYDRLLSGTHNMHVNWDPRDGSPTVRYVVPFEKP